MDNTCQFINVLSYYQPPKNRLLFCCWIWKKPLMELIGDICSSFYKNLDLVPLSFPKLDFCTPILALMLYLKTTFPFLPISTMVRDRAVPCPHLCLIWPQSCWHPNQSASTDIRYKNRVPRQKNMLICRYTFIQHLSPTSTNY